MKRIMNQPLLQELKKYKGKWIALFGSDDEIEIVPASDDAAEASEAAAKKDYRETTLLK
jgi:uncharacterized protein DUF5678